MIDKMEVNTIQLQILIKISYKIMKLQRQMEYSSYFTKIKKEWEHQVNREMMIILRRIDTKDRGKDQFFLRINKERISYKKKR